MNDELQKQLAAFIQQLLAAANDVDAVARSQIPPLLQEKILYGRLEHSVLGILFAVVTWRAAVLAQQFFREARADKAATGSHADFWPERPGGLASIGAAVVAIGFAVGAVIHLDYAVMAWVSPRLFIVEWLLWLKKSG